MWVFLILALVGLTVSAIAHFSTCMGVDPQDSFPYIWLLHIGIFVVFLPAIAIQSLLPRDQKGNLQPLAFAPRWMQRLTIVAFIYMIVNFVVFIILTHAGSPYKENGRYVLRDHGKFVRSITQAQYHRYRAYEVRGFSGHWVFFYLAAVTTLVSGIRYRSLVGDSDLSAGGLTTRTGHRPLWVHTIFAVILQAIGFFAGPALYITGLEVFHWRPGCFGMLLWLATPWPGLAFALYLLQNKLPAECPNCGGRAFFVSSRGNHYRCADCGWTGG